MTNLSNLQQPQKVLICFRGINVRHKLLSFLKTELRRYNIEPLIDSDELTGHRITKIFDLIRGAEMVLAIITDKSSESRWCLDELVVMKKQHEAGSLVIIPIFYNVYPHEVKKQTGVFGTRLSKAEEGVRLKVDQSQIESMLDTEVRIQEWRQALAYVVEIGGITYIPKTDEDKFVSEIRVKLQKRLQDMSQETKHIKEEESLVDNQEEIGGISTFLQATKLDKSHLEDLIHSKPSTNDIKRNTDHLLFLDLNSIDKPTLVQRLIEQGQAGKIVLVLLGSLEYTIKGFHFKTLGLENKPIPTSMVSRSFGGGESSNISRNRANRAKTCFSFLPANLIAEFLATLISSPSVFISFGEDKLGRKLVSSLKEKLAINKISCVKKDSLDESRVAIVVFSSGYPDSEECLDELVKIKKLMDEGKLHVLPVFYDLPVLSVKKLTGWFINRLVKIQDRVRKTVVKGNDKSILDAQARIHGWREAILSISSKSDLSNNNRTDPELCSVVVTEVKKLLYKKKQKLLLPTQEMIFYTLDSFLEALNYEKTDVECFREMSNDVYSLRIKEQDTSLVLLKLTCHDIRLLSQRIAELKRFKELSFSLS